MDFRGRTTNTPVTPTVTTANVPGGGSQFKKVKHPAGQSFTFATVGLLFSITAILILLCFLLFNGGNQQGKLINKSKYQAVFLNNGQVYFGHIKDINSRYYNVQDIFYLQTSGGATDGASTNTTTAPTNVSLVKLGCELHAPYDRMVINNDQVVFWENLQDSSQVVKAVNKFKTDNPKGQNCSNASQSTSTQQATPTTTVPTTTTPTTTTPSTSTGTTTKKP